MLGVCLLFLTSTPSNGQDNAEKKNTYFHNISIDSEGHVCYFENMWGSPLNRIEYRTNGKSTLDIFFEDDIARMNVQLTDFNNDGNVDLIYVMRENLTKKKGAIRKIDFYRGPEYLEHLKRHYKHALLTATHPLIKHRPDEQERAKQIEKDLEALDNQRIRQTDTGTYTQEDLFIRSQSVEITDAFSASDTLNVAVRSILSGDFRVLSKTPEITTKYNLEINTLLGIDPAMKFSERK